MQAQDSKQKNIGEVLWLAWGKQLGDHVVGLWDGEDYDTRISLQHRMRRQGTIS